MDIRGEQVGFTPTEAQLVQSESLRFRRAPWLALRILQARHAFAAQWFDTSTLPKPEAVAQMPPGVEALAQVLHTNNALEPVEREHAVDPNGNERPEITATFTPQEKLTLLQLALTTHRVTREIMLENEEIPEIVEMEDEVILDNAASFFATSDLLPADQAVALSDLLHDPELIAAHKAQQDEENAQTIATTADIILALVTDFRSHNN